MDNPQLQPVSFQYQIRSRPGVAPSINKFHQGIFYMDFLQRIHEVKNPFSYLEIGVETGATLVFAQCPSVGIDPDFLFQGNPVGRRVETFLFQLPSDDFFSRYDLNTFLPNKVDFAFLDGMHHFEFLLRDFMNTEKYSHPGTLVVMHDCYPVNTEIANRERNYDQRADTVTRRWWTGDVWKLLPILRDFRPELDVVPLDCTPTGLVVVQGLDPNSDRLRHAYEEIVAKYRDITLQDYGIEKFWTEFPTSDSKNVFEPDSMRRFLSVRS